MDSIGVESKHVSSTGKPAQAVENFSRYSWAEDFLFAGFSGFLLLCANIFPQWWFVSLFAVAPFLYRTIDAQPSRSLRLGALFGLSFFGVTQLHLCPAAPVIACLKIAGGAALFATWGWTVSWGRRRYGFNPLIVSLLWVLLELAVSKLGYSGGLLAGAQASQPMFHGMAALFGFLSISFVIVLLNSILIYALEAVAGLSAAREMCLSQGERNWDLLLSPGPAGNRAYLFSLGRAPPDCNNFA